MVKIIVKKNDANQTIISFLKKVIDYKNDRINLYKLLRTKKIKINNKVVKDPKFIINENDAIDIFYVLNLVKKRDFVKKEKINLSILYEDENILVVVKEHNVLVHNSYGSSLDSMVKNYLINKNEYNPDEEQSFVISHINRIDKLTKGLVIYAKNKLSQNYFLKQIKFSDNIKKFYLLKCEKKVSFNKLKLKGFLYKNEKSKKMVFSENKIKNAKEVATNFKLIRANENESILEAQLLTGRKNQIRASLEYLKHPILNDYKYGAKKINDLKKIDLFAYKIIFNNLDDEFKYLNNKIIEMKLKI